MGFDNREPKEKELAEMKELLKEAMDEGAFGLSTGLIYPPGCFSKTEELIELAADIAVFDELAEVGMRRAEEEPKGGVIAGGIEKTRKYARVSEYAKKGGENEEGIASSCGASHGKFSAPGVSTASGGTATG
jgi:hypothetical protein